MRTVPATHNAGSVVGAHWHNHRERERKITARIIHQNEKRPFCGTRTKQCANNDRAHRYGNRRGVFRGLKETGRRSSAGPMFCHTHQPVFTLRVLILKFVVRCVGRSVGWSARANKCSSIKKLPLPWEGKCNDLCGAHSMHLSAQRRRRRRCALSAREQTGNKQIIGSERAKMSFSGCREISLKSSGAA
jgi:hypothetical protein